MKRRQKPKHTTRSELIKAETFGDFAKQALHLTVLHDAACTPGVCVCNPEFRVEPLTPEAFAAGQQAQDRWIKESTS